LTKLFLEHKALKKLKYRQLTYSKNTVLESKDLHFLVPHANSDSKIDDCLYFRQHERISRILWFVTTVLIKYTFRNTH